MRSLLVLLLSTALSGCGDDWGSKIEEFVDKEVHGLTVAIAEAELRVRWFDYFSGLTSKSILVVDAANKLADVTAISQASIDSFEHREKLLDQIDAWSLNAIQAERMLRSGEAELASVENVCTSAAASMHRVDVGSIGTRIASQIALPKSDWYVELSCQFGGGGKEGNDKDEQKSNSDSGCWKSLVSIVTALFGADKQRQQQDKANTAIAKIPSKVVSFVEVEEASQRICTEASKNQTHLVNLEIARNALQSSRKNMTSASKAIDTLRASVNAVQMPVLLQKVRDGAGIEQVAVNIVREYELQHVIEAMDLQRKDLASFEKRFNDAAGCAEALAASELFGRVLVEKKRQLEAAAELDSPYQEKFRALLKAVVMAESSLSGRRSIKVSERCEK